MQMRRVLKTGLAAAAAAVALAAFASASQAATTTITGTDIGGASLALTDQAYRDHFGAARKETLPGTLTRLVFAAKSLDVYFATGTDSGIAVVTRGAVYKTSKGIGPC